MKSMPTCRPLDGVSSCASDSREIRNRPRTSVILVFSIDNSMRNSSLRNRASQRQMLLFGIETMLSLRCVLPKLPTVAAVSAAHLATLVLPVSLRRIYIAVDNYAAGRSAASALTARAHKVGIDAFPAEDGFLLRPTVD